MATGFLIPVYADFGDRRRQPLVDDGVPKGRHGAVRFAVEDGSDCGLLLGTDRRIEVEPGLAVPVMKVARPVGEHGKLRAGKIDTLVRHALRAFQGEYRGTPTFIGLNIPGQPTRAEGLAAANLEAASG